jgi:tetratricopeptide (TPR) repeat protein
MKFVAPFVSLLLMVGLALIHMSCQPTCHSFDPVITCQTPTIRIETNPSAFPPFSENERNQEWATEIRMGNAFAKESDFYRAITCYKRAQVLLPADEPARRMQIDYDLILCYYYGNKYREALNIFEASSLAKATPTFPAFNQLLLIIYDSYLQTNQVDKADCIKEAIFA